jgi:hypothetical protein
MEEYGIEAVDMSALEVLVDLTQRYTEELGVVAQSFAEHAGREQSNAVDVHNAIVDVHQVDPLGMFRLFLNHLQAKATTPTRKNIEVPHFPVEPPIKQRKILTGSGPRPLHIPSHLPTYPDQLAHKATAAPIDTTIDKTTRIKRKDLEKQQAESNLTALVEKQSQVPLANYESRGFVDGTPNKYIAEQPAKPPVVVPPSPFNPQETIKSLVNTKASSLQPPQRAPYLDDAAQRASQIVGLTQSARDGEVLERLEASRKRAEAEDGDIDD